MTIAIVGHQMQCVDKKSEEMSARLATYISLYDTPAFLSSALCPGAAYRDLLFIRGMREFQRVDSEIASRVLQSLTGQTWYLDQPWIVTALVGPDVPAEEKEEVARSLAATPRPSSFPPFSVTPTLPKLPCHQESFWPKDGSLPSLSSLVGPRTWLLFNLLQLEEAELLWLTLPSNVWQDHLGFTKLSQFLSSLEVVNDAGERAVKLIQVICL